MPTIEEIQAYFAYIGVPVPPTFIIQLWLDTIAVIQPCLDGAGYSPAAQMQIYLYLLGLYSTVNADRFISSQTAPSGASQSFKYKDLDDKYRGILNSLALLDTSGCTDSVIPAMPGPTAGLWVSTGGKCC